MISNAYFNYLKMNPYSLAGLWLFTCAFIILFHVEVTQNHATQQDRLGLVPGSVIAKVFLAKLAMTKLVMWLYYEYYDPLNVTLHELNAVSVKSL